MIVELDKICIGNRIREIREKNLKMSRPSFTDKTGFSENQLGKVERGVLLPSLKLLNCISSLSGVPIDTILYENITNKQNTAKENLHIIINRSSKEELELFYKIIVSFNTFNYKTYQKYFN